MTINPLSDNSEAYLQSIWSNTLGATNSAGSRSASPLSALQDSNQISPFAQVLSSLQQLLQQNPTQYQQVTQQIATNLQNAAQAAQAAGNTTQANQLGQLATDFQNASTSGRLPNVSDLAQAMHGHHHHHFHGAGGGLNQLLDNSQSSGTTSDSQSAAAIIENTLSSAGVSGSN